MKFVFIFTLLLATASPAFSRDWIDGCTECRDKFSPNCIFHGNDLRSVGGAKVSDCGRICYNEPQCTHFTHAEEHLGVYDTCYLKRSTKGWFETPTTKPGYTCGFIPGRSDQSVGSRKN